MTDFSGHEELGTVSIPKTDAPDLESTALLLDLAQNGDETARSRLLTRYMPILHR